MKKIASLIFTLGTLSLISCAQGSGNAPAAVQTAFSAKFPDVQKVSWDQEEDGVWEAEFKVRGKAYSANFTKEGSWKETEYELAKTDIPSTVMASLKEKYPDAKIEEMEMLETPDGKFYEIEIATGETTLEVALDANGTVVKEEVLEEHEDRDED